MSPGLAQLLNMVSHILVPKPPVSLSRRGPSHEHQGALETHCVCSIEMSQINRTDRNDGEGQVERSPLCPEERNAIGNIVQLTLEVLVVLPTGFGKSLIFQLLQPWVNCV